MKTLSLSMLVAILALGTVSYGQTKPVDAVNKELILKLERSKLLEEQGGRRRSVREIIEKGEMDAAHVRKISEIADSVIQFELQYRGRAVVPGVTKVLDVSAHMKGALGSIIRMSRKSRGENIDPIVDQLLANYKESAEMNSESGETMAKAVADIFSKAEAELDAIMIAKGKAANIRTAQEKELAAGTATMGNALYRVAFKLNQSRKGGLPDLQRLLECARGTGLAANG